MRVSAVQPAVASHSLESAPSQRRSRTPPSKLAQGIDTSPRLTAQAQRKAALFGVPVQRQKAPAHHLPHESEEDETHQLKAATAGTTAAQPTSTPNRTGLPDNLKAGIESLSGMSMDHVKVHYNSAQPAQLNALAYAQGSDIHVAPGQEKHLPHEAWHVVQQAQGRVKPTMQMKGGVPVNDDAGLEREADMMGARSAMHGTSTHLAHDASDKASVMFATSGSMPVQRAAIKVVELPFLTTEELLELLNAASFAELLELSDELKHTYPATSKEEGKKEEPSEPVPAHVPVVQNYIAKQMEQVSKAINDFCEAMGYVASKGRYVHALFGNDTITLYPCDEKNPRQGEKASHRPHRPVLDVELVGRTPYARCYLGLYASAPTSDFKDITANSKGEITMTHVGLMNLGNPFKALLWCEDYLTNQEHYKNSDKDKTAPKPVVRSFLVPLSDARGLLMGEGAFSDTRPLDQDRGAGQFGSLNKERTNLYGEVLQPLIGSLVSFFHDEDEYRAASDTGQGKFGLATLQEYLTGSFGDPRSMTKSGIAAQHGRGSYKTEFEAPYDNVMAAYYDSVHTDQTGFSGATGSVAPNYRKSTMPKAFDAFPRVKREAGLLSKGDLASKDSPSKAFGKKGLAKPSPVIARLRAFIDAYMLLPVTPVAGGIGPVEGNKASDGQMESGGDSIPFKDVSTSKEQPASKDEPPQSVDKSEKASAKNQYAKAEGLAGPAIPANWFNRLANPGGGDCLFHALAGRTLNPTEILAMRGRVATVRRRTPDEPLGLTYNANVAAATITQTPALDHIAPLVMGRLTVPNRVLALLQSVPGVYAGAEELIQWCKMERRTVFVLDQDGTVSSYNSGGSQTLFVYRDGQAGSVRRRNQIRRLVNRGNLVLYKSPAHWERVQSTAS